MLALQDKAELHATHVMRAARWKKVEPLAKSYIGNTIHLLGAHRHCPPFNTALVLSSNSKNMSSDWGCARGGCLRAQHAIDCLSGCLVGVLVAPSGPSIDFS